MSTTTDTEPAVDTAAAEAAIRQVFAEAGVNGRLYARELGTDGPEVSVGGDEPVVLASVFKILVLVAYARAVHDGTLDPTERLTVGKRYRIGGIGLAGYADDVQVTARDLALVMMTMSDNAATDVLFHRLGKPAVDQVIADLELEDTVLHGCCEDLFETMREDLGAVGLDDLGELLSNVTDEQLIATRANRPVETNHSTPRQVARLVEAIWNDTAAAPEACATARDILVQQIWPHRLSSGFDSDVVIGAKTGTIVQWRNEAGVLTFPDGRRYAVAVFTQADSLASRQPKADRSIGDAGRIAVDALRAPLG